MTPLSFQAANKFVVYLMRTSPSAPAKKLANALHPWAGILNVMPATSSLLTVGSVTTAICLPSADASRGLAWLAKSNVTLSTSNP